MVKEVQDQSNDDGIITEDKPKKGATARGFKRVREPQKPGNFAVIFHNDNYTTRDFVVYVLQEVFHHSSERAEKIMMSVHNEGVGIAGVYRLEIAEQRAYDTVVLAKENQYPLKITVEEMT